MPHKESRSPRSRIRIVSLSSRQGTAVYPASQAATLPTRHARLWQGFGKPGGKLEASARAVGARGQNFYMLFGVTNRFLIDLATFPDHGGAKPRTSSPRNNGCGSRHAVPGWRERYQSGVPYESVAGRSAVCR